MSANGELSSIDDRLPAEYRRSPGRDTPTFTNVQRAALALVITAHLSAGVLVLNRAWITSFSTLKFTLIAIPLAQNSLVAQAAMGKWAKPYVRFSLAIVATVWCWFVAMHLMGWSFSGPGAASMALSFAVQSSVIASAHQFIHGRSFGDRRFGISSMLGWLTAAAIVLALLRRGPISWGWSIDAISWDFFLLMPIVCLGTGLVTVVVDASLSLARPVWQRVLAFAVGVAILVFCVPMFAAKACGLEMLTLAMFASIAIAVSLLLYLTLLPVRYVFAGDTREACGSRA